MGPIGTETIFRLLTPIANTVASPFATLSKTPMGALQGTVDYRLASEITTPLGPDATNDFIARAVEIGGPCLMARFGSTELRLVLRHHGRKTRNRLEKFYALFSRLESPWWVPWEHQNIRKKSGFYPVSKDTTDRFVDLMMSSMEQLDLLASWVQGENKIAHRFPEATVTTLEHFNQLQRGDLWTKKLKGKKVLVIHPFEESIRAQYKKRHLLHEDPELLPEFDLKIVKSVQSLGTPPPEFASWFEGLEHMYSESQKVDYDVALIAAGAYSLPLASKLKDAGRTVLVLGGSLQLLFGIMGKRWDSSSLYNEHWVRPLSIEKPDGFKGADGGAYW